MHLTATGSTCSMAGIWKSTRQSYGSSRPVFLLSVNAVSICSFYDGLMDLSARAAERRAVGRQGAER